MADDTTTDTARLLDRLAAEAEIRNLIARVAHLADDGDIDEYLDLWTEDSSWGRGNGDVRTGREPRRQRVHEDRADGTQGPGTHSRHLNTTLWVAFDDDDHARAESYFLYLRDATTAPHVKMTGRYQDRFRRTPDGWKFAGRQIVLDVN